jgi:hypothetical protein
MAVLVTVATRERAFFGGLRWVPHARRPSLRAIRQEALKMGMTHFIRPRQLHNRIGYLRMVADTASDRKAISRKTESLLLAVLAQSEALTYVECDFGPSGTWILATDENALPLPGSDSFFDEEDLPGFRSSLEGFSFRKRITVENTAVDAFLESLPPAPVKIRSISFRPYYVAAGVLAVGGLITLQSFHVFHERNLARLRDEAQRNLLLERQRAQAATHDEPSAAEWVRICMHHAYALPPYRNGWALTNWECAGKTLSAIWQRAGGTLATAPVGLTLNNGNSVRSSYPLMPFEKIQGAPGDAAGDARAFIAFVQQSETNLSIKTTSLVQGNRDQSQSAYMISFPWQGDPREIPWDTFRNITVQRLGREINADSHGGSQATDYQIHVAIKDASAAPLTSESEGR